MPGLGRRTGHGVYRLGAWALALTAVVVGVLPLACGKRTPVVDMANVADGRPSEAGADDRDTLRVAVGAMISPETTRRYYEALMTLIADRLGRRAVFLQRRSYAEVNAMVASKEADVAYVCSGPYTQGHDEFGMELLVAPVAHGKTVYHSYIIARRDSDAESFGDLEGAVFAFTDPQSNTGCLVPTYMLAKRGRTPQSYFKRILFTHSHDNSIRAVAQGQADGAAVDSLIYEFMDAVEPTLTSRIKVVEKSPPYGIPPVVVHPQLDPDLKARLKAVFLLLHEDKEAKPLLSRIQIDKFVEADDSMYDTVRDMRQWVRQTKGE